LTKFNAETIITVSQIERGFTMCQGSIYPSGSNGYTTATIKHINSVPRISTTDNLLVKATSSVFQERSAVTTIAQAKARKKLPPPTSMPSTLVSANEIAVVTSNG